MSRVHDAKGHWRLAFSAGVAFAVLLAPWEAHAANLLVNGDAETGDLTGWVDPIGNDFFVTGSFVAEGSFAFHAGESGPEGEYRHEIYQDVDVSAMADAIDAGNATFVLTGLVQNNEAGLIDEATVLIEFRDGSGDLIPPALLASPTRPTNTWVALRRVVTPVPGTRRLRVRLVGERFQGVSTEAFFDALSLTLSPECAMPPAPVASWWAGDQTPIDRSGPNDGTLMNGTDYTGGLFDDAFRFDGIDDWVSIGDVLDAGTGDFSISAWIRPEPSGSVTMQIVNKGVTYNESPNRPGYGMNVRFDGELSAMVSDDAADNLIVVTSDPVFPFDDQFHHVAAVIDRSADLLRLYLDGVEVATGDISAIGDIRSSTYLAIGAVDRAPFGPSANHFGGAIDEVQISRRALSPCEISDAAGAARAGICKGDRDLDGSPDGSDNCPSDANADQSDGDGDGHGDTCDCAATDPALAEPPGEVPGLAVDKQPGEEVVSWSATAACGAGGDTFDLVRGRLDELPVGAGASETCLESQTAAESVSDPERPAVGAGFYYLVRGRNGCGWGTYGAASDGNERVTATCP